MIQASETIALPTQPASVTSARPTGSAGASVERGTVIDYDVQGVLGVRLVDASPADVRLVERHLRGFRRPLDRDPDLLLRYVDRVPTGALDCVDVERSGFDGDGFVVRGGNGPAGWVRIPFEQLGGPCELVAERGVGQIPYFKPMLRLAALRRGYVPLHASAFEWAGAGVLVTGWTHGGKTSALLAFAEQGARFIGDDLVLLAGDGDHILGLSTPLNVSSRQLRQSPRLAAAVPRAPQLVLGALDRLDAAEGAAAAGWPAVARALGVLRRAARPVRRRFALHVPPEVAFWNGVRSRAHPRTLILMMSHRRAGVSVERVDPMDVAERMIHSMRFEDLGLLGEYLAFRFAFPEARRANELIERAHEVARARLRRAVAGMDTYVVRHAYPPPLHALHEAMRPLCERGGTDHGFAEA